MSRRRPDLSLPSRPISRNGRGSDWVGPLARCSAEIAASREHSREHPPVGRPQGAESELSGGRGTVGLRTLRRDDDGTWWDADGVLDAIAGRAWEARAHARGRASQSASLVGYLELRLLAEATETDFERVQAAGLSSRQQIAWLLRQRGISRDTAAEAMGVTPQAFGTHLRRAEARLRAVAPLAA